MNKKKVLWREKEELYISHTNIPILPCKSAFCLGKWKMTWDLKIKNHVLPSHQATSVPEQLTASSANMEHVWGLIFLPLMVCQNSGPWGQWSSYTSNLPLALPLSFSKAPDWPLIWAIIFCLDAVTKHTKMPHTCSSERHKNEKSHSSGLCVCKVWSCVRKHKKMYL